MLSKKLPTSFATTFKKRGHRFNGILAKARSAFFRSFPVFLFLSVLFLVYSLSVIRNIHCGFDTQPCPPNLIEKLEKLKGISVIFLNQKSLTSSIKSSFPVEKVSLGFKLFNTLDIRLEGRVPAINVQMALVNDPPEISTLVLPESTTSALVTKPTEEIASYFQRIDWVNFDFWDTGEMSPTVSAESSLKYVFTSKPDVDTIKSIYNLVKIAEKYLSVDQVMVVNQLIFLRQSNQPDIIISIPYEKDVLIRALQSFAYLTTIKKDAKIIDLRFKNPILR